MASSSNDRQRGGLENARATSPMIYSLLLCLTMARIANAGFVDMDTPLDKRTTTSLVDGTVYHLVSCNTLASLQRLFVQQYPHFSIPLPSILRR